MCMKGTSTLLNKWDERYLELADCVATWSKDPSRKIGAIAIGSKGQVLAQGYNGFPRGVEEGLADHGSHHGDRPGSPHCRPHL